MSEVPICIRCGKPCTLVGHGIGFECLNDDCHDPTYYETAKDLDARETKCNLPNIGAMTVAEDFGDPQQLLVLRNWLAAAVRQTGAEVYGSGIGCGQADLDVTINGVTCNISVRPK